MKYPYRRWNLLIAFVCGLWWSSQAYALEDAPDIVDASARGSSLPEVPETFVTRQLNDVRWNFPAEERALTQELMDTYREHWPRLVDELGGDIPSTLEIRIARSPAEMQRLAPSNAPPPAYATGVAYPELGLVILSLISPTSWTAPPVEYVFVHELSHIALHRAVDGQPIPRWFSEGVAIYQSSESNFDRLRILWEATSGNRLLPLSRLSGSFPNESHRVNLAYAQSADFVRFLFDRGRPQFVRLLGSLRNGDDFDTAIHRSYMMSLPLLEVRWTEGLHNRFQALPLLVGSGSLWVIATILLFFAYRRRRHQRDEKYEQWAEEEAEEAALFRISQAATSTQDEISDELDAIYVLPPEPKRSEAEVPTVRHNGRSHILH